MRLQVVAPSDVRVGEVFQSRIDLDAINGLRQLLFDVTYDRKRLALQGWSEGSFVRQGAAPAQLAVDEASDGNIQIRFNVADGLTTAGGGVLVVFEFEAIRPGTSAISLLNLTSIDGTGSAGSYVDVLPAGSVTIH